MLRFFVMLTACSTVFVHCTRRYLPRNQKIKIILMSAPIFVFKFNNIERHTLHILVACVHRNIANGREMVTSLVDSKNWNFQLKIACWSIKILLFILFSKTLSN